MSGKSYHVLTITHNCHAVNAIITGVFIQGCLTGHDITHNQNVRAW
ncbi:hypothetical protein [Coleofasciculus sp. G2-EDA-02]